MTVGELKEFLKNFKDSDIVLHVADGFVNEEETKEFPQLVNQWTTPDGHETDDRAHTMWEISPEVCINDHDGIFIARTNFDANRVEVSRWEK